MPANTTPIFTLTPIHAMTSIATANTNRDGTGTIGTVYTPGSNGGRIDTLLDSAASGGGGVTVDEFSNDALAQLAALRRINAHGALVSEGLIQGIVIGDDYLTADGRQLQFANAAGSWPDQTGATISLTFYDPRGNDASVTVAGTVHTPTGSGQRLDVQLTAAQTATLKTSHTRFRLDSTLANGHETRPEEGVAEVSD